MIAVLPIAQGSTTDQDKISNCDRSDHNAQGSNMGFRYDQILPLSRIPGHSPLNVITVCIIEISGTGFDEQAA